MPETESFPQLPNPAEVPIVRLRPMAPSVVGAAPESGIGERIRYGRAELSLSVEALSRLTKRYDTHESKGVSPTSLARYESGESLPGARELRLLCQALAVPPQWLLLGDLPNMGKSQAQQALLDALGRFVREAQSDINVGGETLSQSLERMDAQSRAMWLVEARKPT